MENRAQPADAPESTNKHVSTPQTPPRDQREIHACSSKRVLFFRTPSEHRPNTVRTQPNASSSSSSRGLASAEGVMGAAVRWLAGRLGSSCLTWLVVLVVASWGFGSAARLRDSWSTWRPALSSHGFYLPPSTPLRRAEGGDKE